MSSIVRSSAVGSLLLVASTVAAYCLIRRRVHKSESQLLKDAKEFLENNDTKIYKFVITGGPCSGKTTAMEKLQVRNLLLA
jgi:hypothetical protein